MAGGGAGLVAAVARDATIRQVKVGPDYHVACREKSLPCPVYLCGPSRRSSAQCPKPEVNRSLASHPRALQANCRPLGLVPGALLSTRGPFDGEAASAMAAVLEDHARRHPDREADARSRKMQTTRRLGQNTCRSLFWKYRPRPDYNAYPLEYHFRTRRTRSVFHRLGRPSPASIATGITPRYWISSGHRPSASLRSDAMHFPVDRRRSSPRRKGTPPHGGARPSLHGPPIAISYADNASSTRMVVLKETGWVARALHNSIHHRGSVRPAIGPPGPARPDRNRRRLWLLGH